MDSPETNRETNTVLTPERLFWLQLLLRPLARFCLRHAVQIQDFLEAAKAVFLEAARAEIAAGGEKVNVSRLSAITGMHRRDVMRLSKQTPPKKSNVRWEPRNLISRIIGQWQCDRRFTGKNRRPKVLALEAGRAGFRTLVASVSNDLNPGTVLFELERLGVVERSAKGVRLCAAVYRPREDVNEGFRMLAADVETLVRAVEENLVVGQKPPNLHGRTEFDNVRPEAASDIRAWLLERGAAWHREAREYLARFDQDITPPEGKQVPGVKVVLGTFGWLDLAGGQR